MKLSGDKPRRPMLTRKEQAILVFLLALLVLGGIVRKLRMEGRTSTVIQAQKP
jgi:hypothetical protein